MESQSLKNELHKYFGYTTECPTNASFNQRRAQISPDAFKDLFFSFTSRYNNNSNLHKGFNQIHLNAMYDLLNRVYTDIIIQPGMIENEHTAFMKMPP